jgi:hypothetical protein
MIALHCISWPSRKSPINNSEKLFNGRFTSFVGLPSTAIFHMPFAALSFDNSVLWYRGSALLAMLLSVFLVGCAVHKNSAPPTWLTGFSVFVIVVCDLFFAAP